MLFSKKILLWYEQNKRELPWRKTIDPYKIWLSEIILQQTRVAQGTPYYEKFISNFPTVFDLANATEEKVLKLWQGLGYYSRARNLHTAAKMVVENYNGIFPGSYKELLKLKGVGDYTASAIASICFNQLTPVVDGNVYRVLARYFGVDKPINSAEGIKYFKQLATEVMSSDNIRDYNQGIMEFGALQCSPKKPLCESCPLKDSCIAFKDDVIIRLPVKINKTKITKRYFNYIVPIINYTKDVKTVLSKRTKKGIWFNLWEFPLYESQNELEEADILKVLFELLGTKNFGKMYVYNQTPIVHKLSHQHLHTKFWIVETEESLTNEILTSELEKYPVPVLIADFIKAFKF